jgi:hypothetical protein
MAGEPITTKISPFRMEAASATVACTARLNLMSRKVSESAAEALFRTVLECAAGWTATKIVDSNGDELRKSLRECL